MIRKKRVATVEIDETMEEVIPDRVATPKEALRDRERADEVRSLLDGLTEVDRAIIVLRYWDDLSDREIGAAVGLRFPRSGTHRSYTSSFPPPS